MLASFIHTRRPANLLVGRTAGRHACPDCIFWGFRPPFSPCPPWIQGRPSEPPCSTGMRCTHGKAESAGLGVFGGRARGRPKPRQTVSPDQRPGGGDAGHAAGRGNLRDQVPRSLPANLDVLKRGVCRACAPHSQASAAGAEAKKSRTAAIAVRPLFFAERMVNAMLAWPS